MKFRSRRMVRLQRAVVRWVSRLKISENTFMVVVAVSIGLLSGLANYGFRKLIDLFAWLTFDELVNLFNITFGTWGPDRFYAIFLPFAPALLLIPFWRYYGDDMRFSFSRFLARVNLSGGKVPGRIVLTRSIACAATIGGGGSAGQEGPIAQIGGAIGSAFGQFLDMSGDRLKTIVACGVSGGVAATFNAPIAGVFFAQEIVLLSSFELSSFTSIVIASGMSTVVSRALLGNSPAFAVPSYQLVSSLEIFFYILLGVLVGIGAATFIKSHFRIKTIFAALALPMPLRLGLGALLVGTIGIGLPQVFGNGYEVVGTILAGHGVWTLLALLVVAKALATSITLGSGMQGGLFAPSLFIGACLGGAFGKLLALLFPGMNLHSGSYALVGMGAFLSAATHAPMTAIFLLFEMTASYQVIVPIMIACVVGTTISRQLNRESLETEELARDGIDLRAGQERNIMKSLTVGDAMSRQVEAIPEGMTLRQFTRLLRDTRTTSFPLVNNDGELTGILSVQDFMGVVFEKDLMDLIVVKEIATLDVITVNEDDDLETALQKIGYRNIEQLPVVDRESGRRLIGIVSRRDMISAYNRALTARSIKEDDDA